MKSPFIDIPTEIKADDEYLIVPLEVRPGAIVGTSPAQDVSEYSEGMTVVYFDAKSGMRPITTPMTQAEVRILISAWERS